MNEEKLVLVFFLVMGANPNNCHFGAKNVEFLDEE